MSSTIDHKDITIGEHKYRIGRLSARVGSWLFKLQTKRDMTEAEHNNVHTHLLSVVARYKEGIPLPITLPSGEFKPDTKDLEFDLETVEELKNEVTDLNFKDFLVKRLKAIAELQSAAQDQPTDSSSE